MVVREIMEEGRLSDIQVDDPDIETHLAFLASNN